MKAFVANKVAITNNAILFDELNFIRAKSFSGKLPVTLSFGLCFVVAGEM